MERRLTAPGLLACLLALALHVLMPAGWMPAAGGLAPCGAQAAADGNPQPDDGNDRCDFALAAAPVLAADAGVATWLLQVPPAAGEAVRLPVLRMARIWPRPPGQGPPRV
jgi:hypothetical protein